MCHWGVTHRESFSRSSERSQGERRLSLSIDPKILVLIIFCAVYVYLILSRRHRALALWVGVVLLVFFGPVTLGNMLADINWNVIGIFAGTLILAELFIISKVPARLAAILVDRSATVGVAVLWVCVLTSFISAFVENVATVLIVAPIALEISRKLKVSPVSFLIALAISSNLQGTATLIGDPPSMILAAYQKMSFNDFFFFQGKPSIFFAVQLGALFSFLVLHAIFRRYRQPIQKIPIEQVEGWTPTVLLGLMVLCLAGSSSLDPDFRYLGGAICVFFALAGLVYQYRRDRRGGPGRCRQVLRGYDLETTFFLAGIFVMVGALTRVGLIRDLAMFIQTITGDSPFWAYTTIVWASVLFSAFVDNVPYLTAMIPVAAVLSQGLGIPPQLLVFGLLIGSCLGGNITPIGASANIVSVGLLRRQGYHVGFGEFVRVGLPFTLAATLGSYLFVLWIWS
jgi:Na+/H+ antiporter NhaD/arsenite permease-like protein